MLKKIKKNKLKILIPIIVLVSCIGIYFFAKSFAEQLEDNVRVAENSDLTYYLDVIYDGKDDAEVTSSDTATASVFSDYINVEDRLPDGLIFQDFETTEDGSIGAVARDESGKSCTGYVVGGYSGLKYEDGVVSFKIKNLQAGCKITVGIKTKTPKLEGKNRMDFYNTAYANEGNFSTNSNTVHVYMGKEEDEITMYTVTYQYSGTPPDNAPPLPAVSSYAPGTTVGVLTDPQVEGYTFSGWTSSNVVVNGGKFTMPTANVVLQGSFTKNATYEVEYKLKSGTPKPDGYVLPKTEEYGVGDDVIIDTLKENDEVDGYRFKGWKVESGGVEISDGGFEMPNNKVVLVGEFERISYKVSYQFLGSVLPSNWQSLLPGEKSYYPGDTVTVEKDPAASGFQFLGWYSDKSFTMPSEDVVITGEWMRLSGTFSPTIEKTIDNSKGYYHKGEVVNFNIKVSNNETYPIIDVMLQENLDGASFIDGSGYTVLNEHYVKINRIEAKSNVVVKAKYTAGDDVAKTIVNEVVLAGALSDPDSGDYVLDSSEEHKAEVSFNVSNISLAINKVNSKSETLSGAEFTLYSDSGLGTVVGKGLKFDNLNFNTTYYLKETKAPTGYVILEKSIPVRIDSSGNISMEGYEVDNKSGTGTVKIINNPVNMLPNTGGIGNIPFVIGGVVIILVAGIGCGYYIIRVRKGKKK